MRHLTESISRLLLAAAFVGALAQSISVAAPRADLVDRNGVVVATTIKVQSIYADPKHVRDPKATVSALATVVPGLDRDGLAARLALPGSFAWVARHVDVHTARAVMAMKLPGIALREEDQRAYPLAASTSHVVGITDYDVRQGVSGAERWFDARLVHDNEPVVLSIASGYSSRCPSTRSRSFSSLSTTRAS